MYVERSPWAIHDAEPGIAVSGEFGQITVFLNPQSPIFADGPQNDMSTGYLAR